MRLRKVAGGCCLLGLPLLVGSLVVLAGFLPPDVLLEVGGAFGRLWVAYAFVLFVVTITPVALILFFLVSLRFFLVAGEDEGIVPWVVVLEIVFALVNPLANLLILTRTSGDAEVFVNAKAWALDGLAVCILGSLWLFRLIPAKVVEKIGEKLSVDGKRLAGGLLVAGMLCVLIYCIRDFHAFAPRGQGVYRNLMESGAAIQGMSFLASVLCLYLFPIAFGFRILRHLMRSGRRIGDSGFLLSPGRWSGVLVLMVLMVFGASVTLLHVRPSPWAAQAWVLSQREPIQEACRRTGADPRLVASVLYELHRRQGSVVGGSFETLVMGTWLTDLKNHLLLAEALNISIGPAQIKPVTAQTALFLVRTTGMNRSSPWPFPYPSKEYRGLPELGSSWRLPADSLAHIDLEVGTLPGKEQVVEELLREDSAIEFCALILELHAVQWEQAHPEWSLRQKPEILASLYQLGFERSHPKAEPSALPFGDAVRRVMEQAWIQEIFPPS